MSPAKIRLTSENRLKVTWDDGAVCEYTLPVLRKNCPCAACLQEAGQQAATYIPLYTRDEITLEAVTPVGHYAVQLKWKDGHATGIYTYAHLRGLCPDNRDGG